MTPAQEAELVTAVQNLTRVLERVLATQERIVSVQNEQAGQIARVDGKIDMLAMWQQTADRRYAALAAALQTKPLP